jgi:uncharacterized membrane protein YidH (DUF202 family)
MDTASPTIIGTMRFSSIQIGLVLFWAIWLSVVTTTNILDVMKQLGALPAGFTLVSYNFELVAKTVGAHGVPTLIAALLFTGVIAWELLASALLWRAWQAMRRGAPATAPEVMQAFAVSLALWATFLIATEVTVNYATASTHKLTLITQLVSLMVMRAQPARG